MSAAKLGLLSSNSRRGLGALDAVRCAGYSPAVPQEFLRVDYLRPARRGDLLAVGRTLRVGRTVSVADVEVRDVTGTLVAVGRGCYASPRS